MIDDTHLLGRWLRFEVLAALEDVAKPRDQTDVHGAPLPRDYLLDCAINNLYDFAFPDPADGVGYLFVEADVAPLEALDAVFGPLIDRLGDVGADAYEAAEEWPRVVEAARHAFEVMTANVKTRYPEPPLE